VFICSRYWHLKSIMAKHEWLLLSSGTLHAIHWSSCIHTGSNRTLTMR
jgi:hypothetical protein